MNALFEYLHMGGFAWFIWPAYALTLGFMIGITVATVRSLRANRRMLAQLEQASPHRQRRAQRASTGTVEAPAAGVRAP